MREMSEKTRKLLVGSVTALLIVIFCGGILLGIQKVLLAEGTMALPEPAPVYLSGEPEEEEEGIALLTKLYENAALGGRERKVKLSVSTDISVDGDSIESTGGSDALNGVLKYMKDDLASLSEELSYGFATAFGEDFSDRLPKAAFSSGDLAEFISEANGDAPKERRLRFVFKDGSPSDKVLSENFRTEAALGVFGAMKEKCRDIFSVEDSELLCTGFEIFARYDAENDRLLAAEYRRNYTVTLTLRFAGELDSLGEKTVSFRLCGKEKYEFTYAGLTLSDRVMWLEKGQTDNVQAFRTADEDVTVTWKSSDEAVAQVDGEGYIKGRAVSTEPVIVTAEFSYLGNTYSETCTVYVRTPVEEVKLAEREHEMTVGETYAPTAIFKPEKAEVRTLCWFTQDESVAKVDENGVITACAPGTADVYAISLDGNFKASVTLTVKGGGGNG